jgi:hypothetical protein
MMKVLWSNTDDRKMINWVLENVDKFDWEDSSENHNICNDFRHTENVAN